MANKELYDKQKLVVENLQAKLLNTEWDHGNQTEVFCRSILTQVEALEKLYVLRVKDVS